MNVNGKNGKNGKSGASPTAGGDGTAATYTLNGTIGLDSTTVTVNGGDGGMGGNGTTGNGAPGGNGGDASATLNSNISNTPASSSVTVDMIANGGDGGMGGTAPIGFTAGPQGNGGNADVNINSNIFQPNKTMTTIDLEAIAVAGEGATGGSATAVLNSNVVQVSKANTVTLVASATTDDPSDSTLDDGNANFGTKSATLNSNVVQGAVTTVTLRADAMYSNASATLTANIVQDSATSGTITLEATGQHIDIENNKVTIGKGQTLDLTVNQLDPAYDTLIKGNEFTGGGTGDTFVFTDNGVSGTNTPSTSPTPDTIVIDLSQNTFTFDGKNNKLKNFNNVTVAGNNDPTIIGDNNANILTGGGSTDTFTGNGGNDTINGNGGADTAIYQGSHDQYKYSFAHTGNLAGTVTDNTAGRDGTDTVTNVEFIQFSDGTYDVVNNKFTPNAAVNHAPAGADKTVSINEDNSYTFATSDFGFTDPNDAPANNFAGIIVGGLPLATQGVLKDNGVTVNNGDNVTAADIAGNKLVFTPAANFHGAPTFTFQVEDDGATGGANQNTDQSPNTMTITVNSVNDAPAGADKTVSINEDNSYTFATSDFGFTDPNDSPANNFAGIIVGGLPLATQGVLKDNGVTVNNGDNITAADIAANKLVFTPAANFHGAPTFTFQVEDDGATGGANQNTDQSPNTMTITVNSVNDAPAGADKTVSINEDNSYTFATSDFGFTDPNDSPANNFAGIIVGGLPLATQGVLKDNGVTVNNGDNVTAADIAGNKLVFTPATNFVGAPTFTFQVEDDGATGGANQNTDQSPNTMTINITSGLNHAPAGADKTVSVNEDNSYTFATSDFGFTDPNDAPANNFAGIIVGGLPLATQGVLKDNGVTVNNGDNVTAADIAGNKLVFTPAANFHGAPTFTFQVEDDGATGGANQNTDQSPNTMTITVNSVNDAPAGADKTVSINEDNSYTFATSDFGFTDPNDSPANNFAGIIVGGLPLATQGVLKDNGVTVNNGDNITAADIAANKLVFTPAANFHGAPTFTFQVEDDGATGGANQNTDQSPNTMTITVNSVNDAPAGADKTVSINEDNSYTFATSDFGFTDPNDSPANNFAGIIVGGLPLATQGVLKDNGVTVNNGDNVTAADIAGNKLVFTPAANFHGAPTFTFQVEDDGATGGANQNTDQSPNTMTITVNSVNDAPVGTPNTINVAENGSYTFAASDFGFTDPNDSPANNFAAVVISSTPLNGTLKDGATTLNAGDTVSVADIMANQLVYTPTVNGSGTDFGDFTFEVQDDGATGGSNQNTDTTPRQMTVNVASVIVVNPGDSIQAAIDAATPGQTIIINAGTYNENVNVNKAGLTLKGVGAVTIEGTFTETNGNFAGPLGTWLALPTTTSYSTASGTGVTVSADNVTLQNITVDDFTTAVSVSGAGVSGLTLDGVTTSHSIYGFTKPDATALNGATITNSTFSDEYIGAGFYNDVPTALDANNTTISNTSFNDIDAKGIYMETAQGNTNLDNLTMTNVGAIGTVPTFNAYTGLNGNGIDINLKFHIYTGNLDINGVTLTNTGTSNGTPAPGGFNENGAIVVEGRDDAPSYSGNPADVSGLNVTIENGTISGTTTGIRDGEIKGNSAQNDTGPTVTVTNVTVTGATVSQIDNHTNSLMTVNGSGSDDIIKSALTPTSTGNLVLNGLGGNDTLQGGLGDDVLNGGPGNDTLLASPGSDTLNGGGGANDTADFSPATNGVNVSLVLTTIQNLGDYGQVKLSGIENLTGTGFADVLTGDGNNNTLTGGAGNDVLVASAGKDTLDGGTGNDTADFSNFATTVTVSANNTGFQTFDAAGDQVKLTSIENLTGGSGDDSLTGNNSNNILIGGAGNDILKGSVGAGTGGTLDIYYGGAGDDTITGTSGFTTDVAYFSGTEKTGITANYTITGTLGANNVHVAGPDAITFDTLNKVDRVKFLSPAHVSDVDNNGEGDLIFQNAATGQIDVVANPSGTLSVLTNSPTSNWQVIGTGQFSPDGAAANARKAGILLQDSGSGDMELITNISGTSSSLPIGLTYGAGLGGGAVPSGTFNGFTAKGTGDFDGDAASDILLWNNTSKIAEIAFLNQNVGETIGTVDAVTTLVGAPTGGNWAPISAGDFNGDGKSDILWQNGPGGAVEVTLMNGATVTNTDTVPLNTAPGYTAVGTGDFDKDGMSDILFSTGGAGSAAEIWTMNGDSVVNIYDINAPTIGASGAGTFTLKGAEDINGDGYSDLLWQNTANGDVVATELTAGGNVLSTANLSAAAVPAFHLIASTGGG